MDTMQIFNFIEFHIEKTTVLFESSTFILYDPSQEVIFPPELKLSPQLDLQNLVLRGPRSTFYRPVTLKEVLQLKILFPSAKIVIGNTEVGIEVKFKNQHYPVIIHPANIPELLQVNVKKSYVEIGSAVPLTDIERTIKNLVKDLPEFKIKVLRSLLEMLRRFAGRQIRNVAGLGGNIMTGSPISDLNPILMAAGAKLTFKSLGGEREVVLDDTFFTGYRTNVARNDEVLTSVKIPFTFKNEYFAAYKQARRRDDDIAIVNAAMKASFEPGSSKVASITLVFGGMAPTTVMAKKTMQKLNGCLWNQHLLDEATALLLEEIKLEPSAPGGMIDYRCALVASFFFKFYLHVGKELILKCSDLITPLNTKTEQLTEPFIYSPIKSTQFFQNIPKNQEKIDPVGQTIPHMSSLKQTTGEAIYIDDLPVLENELFGALVTSSRAHAKILGIDYLEAMEMKGVLGFFSAKDLPGERNKTGYLTFDEEVFASDEVKCVGQVIGIVVATEQSLAERATKNIKIHYEDLPNPIFTIEEAIKAGSMWDPSVIESGDVEKGFRSSDHVLEGKMRLGGQEHFYLEPNVHIAIPHEDNEMELLCSFQALNVMQSLVAKALDIPANRVICKTKRIGGGFGGKQARPIAIAIPAAVAAASLQRPVRITLDRHKDMLITGGRQPYLGQWKVGFNKDGTINALDTKFYSNAGCSLDLCESIVKKSLFNVNGAYKINNIRAKGQCCKTNLPSNTAFRGFGCPQAIIIMEDVIANIADFLQVDAVTVKEKNMYGTSIYKTHFGQEVSNCTVKQCWDQVIVTGEYQRRKASIKDFNRLNSLKKRGIAAVPFKFSVGFGPNFLNQAGALVLVYTDGSVLLSHGGIEMGQGLHTKMIQVASRVLKLPMENIYIAETATDKVPNTSATAASVSSDLNGMAIVDACTKIMSRLEPYRRKMPEASWKDWVSAAYLDRVSLSATGFYKVEHISEFDFEERKSGQPFSYFSYGASLSAVEIDCLTGDHQVLRTDIMMDVGNSLNPAIDIGQIEGAFMQGYGLLTIEQLLYSPSGDLLTKGPGAYKIPSVMDIPREFNVSLLRDSSNPRAIFSSKAIGESPLLSGVSVFFAIREAVKAARGDGAEGPLRFDSPATAERIRMACIDWITQKIKPRNPCAVAKPWAIDVSN